MPLASRKRPEIENPPVAKKKGVPPDERPNEAKASAYVKPKGIHHPLGYKSATIGKNWFKFMLHKNKFVLASLYNQTHKKFRLKTNGMQGACNSLVACIISKMYKMETWSHSHLDQILSFGDALYEKSKSKNQIPTAKTLEIHQIYPTFYLNRFLITFQFTEPTDAWTFEAKINQDHAKIAQETLEAFFSKNTHGVMKIDCRHVGIWKYGPTFFLFDPTEHEKDGEKWKGLISTGFAICVRFVKLKHMAEFMIKDNWKGKPIKGRVWAVEMVRCEQMMLKPPMNLLEETGKEEATKSKIPAPHKHASKIPVKKGKKGGELSEQPSSSQDVSNKQESELIEEISPESDLFHEKSQSKKNQNKVKTPLEPHRTVKGLLHFTTIDYNKGILRGTTHQTDNKFSRFRNGEQSLSQACAALVMRRTHFPTRDWIRKYVNDILKLGETIHHKSLKGEDGKEFLRHPEGPFKLSNITKKIIQPEGTYTLKYEELAVLGKLESDMEAVLDLLPALMTFLRTYDCCIVNGPLVQAVWTEDNKYFMYDPNERDEEGRILEKLGDEKVKGVACVMWFNSLKDLVKLYMENTPKERRRDDFYLSKVTVEDHVGLPDNWNHFKALDQNRWILRGTFSQANPIFPEESRNTQCTANAAMSIAFVHIKEPEQWTKHTMDQVLLSGDEYYRATAERLKATNNFFSTLLMADELNRQFSFSNKEVKFEIWECHVNGALGFPDEGDVVNIKMGLKKFFEDFDFGILTSRAISVGVWKIKDVFYCFDSHDRDDKGFYQEYGTSCLIRNKDIESLAKTIETNLRPNHFPYFNISGVKVQILDADEEVGTVRQPLNHFKARGEEGNIAILLSRTSNKDPKYEFNAGKQTTPMCVAAMGMNRLRPSALWDQDLLQDVLDIGHKYFEDCMAKQQTEKKDIDTSADEPPPETAEDDEESEDKGITFRNLASQFKIGINKFEVTPDVIAEGFVEDGLEIALDSFFTQEAEVSEDDKLELLVETENITVAVWKDDNLYYVFDPYPRDQNGQVIGKDLWSAKEETPQDEPEQPEAEATSKGRPPAAKSEPMTAISETGGGGDASSMDIEEIPKRPKSRGEGVFAIDPADLPDDDANGKACILFFYNLEDVVNHILENTRPNRRSMMPFSLVKINLVNTPMLKEFYMEGVNERKDEYSGDYHNFIELDHGHWILRGEVDLENQMFPKENRGKQGLPTLLASLAFAKLFSMSKMTPRNMTSILQYGDRLLTYTKRSHKEELEKNTSLNLLEDEIRGIVENETYHLESFPKTFVVGDWKIHTKIARDKVNGDMNAKDECLRDLNVKKALVKFFETCAFGVLECQGYAVAVWKGINVIYMFDPHKTDVMGVYSFIGFPCITRYLKTEKLAEIFDQNVSKEGLRTFKIHEIEIKTEKYTKPEDKTKAEVDHVEKISAYKEVKPGIYILRGSFAQDDRKFGHEGIYTLNAPIAFVALTMSLIHKPSTWAKPIVDEVILVGNDLFELSMERAGGSFNPWEKTMEPQMVTNDFNVGVLPANCQLRNAEETGVMASKDPRVANLRRALERFFNENTHGILYSPPNICYAVWEEECCNGQQVIYLFDPNKRGPKGTPSPEGTSCVITFISPKLAYEHILSNLDDPEEQKNEFKILPVEIVVGSHRTQKKPSKKAKTKKKNNNTTTTSPAKTCEDKLRDVLTGSKKLMHQKIMEEKRAKVKKVFELKKMSEMRKLFWQSRKSFFLMSKGQMILRGTRSLTSNSYQEKTRGFQGIPVCIVAFVAHCIVPINEWTWKEIDAVLDTGDQLYIDSYIAYSPRDKHLGLENVVRNIYVMNRRAHVTIYKPITIFGFHPKELTKNFEKWFIEQDFCMLNFMNQWVGIFYKKGYYFLFDPHSRGPTGCKKGLGKDVAACVIRFDNLSDMTLKIFNNLTLNDELQGVQMEEVYDLVLVKLEGGVCQCE